MRSIDNANLPPALRKYAPMIDAASRATGVPADILAAQLWQESRGQADATSINPGNGKTDVGLMQINPDTFAQLQREHPELRGRSSSDPATNILAAGYLMGDLLKQYGGNLGAALRVYNSGSVNLANPNIAPGGIGDPNYVKSVSSFVADLRSGTSLPG
jgi:soluble lytic murein transglycosylase-like protein